MFIKQSLIMKSIAIICLCVAASWALPQQPRRIPVKDIGGRIINGEQASRGQFPWQVAIIASGSDGAWFCGGSLISNEWVLTAAHCVDGARSFEIYAGTVSLNPLDSGAVTATSSRGIPHSQYNDNTLENDIAVIELSSPISFNSNIQAIDLASNSLGSGVDVTISGWGLTSDSAISVSNSLNYVGLQSISNSQCGQYYGAIDDGIVCTSSNYGSQVRSTCSGDSGGPLIQGSTQVGIVSFGSTEGCESGAPSGYSRVAYFRDWIRQQTGV